MNDEVLMEHISWQDLERAISENYTLILVVGSVEQHGPHLPLGTDVFIPLGIAKAIAQHTKVIIAPPLYYTYYSRPGSGGGQSFCGTTSISGSTLITLIKEITEEFIRHGFKKILVLNGHFENSTLLAEGVEKALESFEEKIAKVLVINWWDMIPEPIIAEIFPEGFPGWDVEHASVTETSLIQTLRSELVQTEKIIDDEPIRRPPYEIIPPPSDIIPKSGVLWKATLASKAKGDRLVEVIVENILKAMRDDLDTH